MSIASQRKKTRRAEFARAVDELGQVRRALGEAYTRFNALTDAEAMETCILEISALRSRYNSAVRTVKALYL